MFEVDHIGGATVLTADPVLMTDARAAKIEEFVKSKMGDRCSAFVVKNEQGVTVGVELFAGDIIERQAFRQELTQVVLG